jgi:hypothetical protein
LWAAVDQSDCHRRGDSDYDDRGECGNREQGLGPTGSACAIHGLRTKGAEQRFREDRTRFDRRLEPPKALNKLFIVHRVAP